MAVSSAGTSKIALCLTSWSIRANIRRCSVDSDRTKSFAAFSCGALLQIPCSATNLSETPWPVLVASWSMIARHQRDEQTADLRALDTPQSGDENHIAAVDNIAAALEGGRYEFRIVRGYPILPYPAATDSSCASISRSTTIIGNPAIVLCGNFANTSTIRGSNCCPAYLNSWLTASSRVMPCR